MLVCLFLFNSVTDFIFQTSNMFCTNRFFFKSKMLIWLTKQPGKY